MYIDELAGKGLDFNIMGELLFNFSLSFVPTALPLAILLAALMTFGNMGEFSELTALKASGISTPADHDAPDHSKRCHLSGVFPFCQ